MGLTAVTLQSFSASTTETAVWLVLLSLMVMMGGTAVWVVLLSLIAVGGTAVTLDLWRRLKKQRGGHYLFADTAVSPKRNINPTAP